MQSGRPRGTIPNGYHHGAEQSVVGQPREQKFYAQPYDMDGQFVPARVPEGYVHEPGYHRTLETMTQPQESTRRALNENQSLQNYNYMQAPSVPANAATDHFIVPTHRATFDPTGQQCPPGGHPRVSTTIWEDEGTLCFQVEARQMTVARREDNDMINGTKLLNVAQMSRGKRDGILKNEPERTVIKVGSMHLKGVWIPFERALELANKNHVTDMLYPLFVKDIKRFLYHPENYARTTAVMNAATSRQAQQTQTGSGLAEVPAEERISLDRTSSMPTPLDRSVSMLTPPSSASTNSDYWLESSHGPISETHARTHSLPGTPATTPPAPGYFTHSNGAPKLYHDPRTSISGNHYGQQPDMQRSYNHSRNPSSVVYSEDDANKEAVKENYAGLQPRMVDHMPRNVFPNMEHNAYLQSGFYQGRAQNIDQLALNKSISETRNTPSNVGHQRAHSRAHSRSSNKVFHTPNLTTQMGRRASMTPGGSPASAQGRHVRNQSSRDMMMQSKETPSWVQQQQQMMYSTPQQVTRGGGHMRQSSAQLPQIYEETPSCRMAYQLHGQGRLNEPYPRLVESGQAFQAPNGSPLRGHTETNDVTASPLNGKKKRERVVSDADKYYPSYLGYEERQESLTPPPITKKENLEESPKRRRSERTGMHSRSGSVY